MDLEAQTEKYASKDAQELQEQMDIVQLKLNGPNVRAEDTDADTVSNTLLQIANPSPLGLLGFAIVSWLSGVTKLVPGAEDGADGNLALAGIFVGGVAQVLAGLMNFAKNNLHPATTFSVYGLHWITQGLLNYERASGRYTPSPSPAASCTYYILLAITTTLLWLPSFRMNRILNFTLLQVIGVFVFDALAAYHVSCTKKIAGVLSCAAATMAFYMCAAELVNHTWNRVVLPVFPFDGPKQKYKIPMYIQKLQYLKSIVPSVPH